jgi:hypothetical protein
VPGKHARQRTSITDSGQHRAEIDKFSDGSDILKSVQYPVVGNTQLTQFALLTIRYQFRENPALQANDEPISYLKK